jgi:hypothetical protein
VTPLEEALIRLGADLTALSLHWALIGGLAVSLRGEPRTTRDVDVIVAVAGDREAEQVVIALRNRGYRELSEGGVLMHRQLDRLVGVRLLPPTGAEPRAIVDVLFASSGIEPEIVAGAEIVAGPGGMPLPLVRTGHLIALKVLAGRPHDLVDATGLLHTAEPRELNEAREALLLIERRGFSAGKELQVELAKLLETGV